MSLNVGELAAFLTLDDTDFQRGMTGSGGAMGNLLGIGRAAAVGIGLALAGGAAYSLAAFTDFDTGMREVLTLMPGISQDAMDDMTGQVKDFATEFGVLPDEVIPALYQALSAGVPPGNVFEFLETAQMAARAGVTDLETAVDGLTSTVNAYGAENISAAQASDLMFTAVRLGKTTFEELSASLFQVNPVAASLGVSFDQVTAALATMTAQGVPTSVATTQLRQMLVELSDSGGELGRTFADLSGQSFTDFVASGGTVQDALGLLQQHAQDSGVGLGELFGSVEAGQAALALTGANAETFASNLDAMGDSAGATEQAYDQMSEGMQFQLDRLKAAGAVFAVTFGASLASVAAPALELAADLMEAFGEGGIRGAIDELRSTLEGMPGWMQVALGAAGLGGLAAIAVVVAGALSFLLSPIVLVAAAIGAFAAAWLWAYENVEVFRNAVDAYVGFLTGTLLPAVVDVASGIVDAWDDLVAWTRERWPAISEAVTHVVNVISDVVGGFLAWARFAWSVWGDDLLSITRAAWEFISETIGNIVQGIGLLIDAGLAIINGDWSEAWDAIKAYLGDVVWPQILNILSTAWAFAKAIMGASMSAMQALWAAGWELIKAAVAAAWDWMLAKIREHGVAVVIYMATLPGRIAGALATLPNQLQGVAVRAMTSFNSALFAGAGSAVGFVASLPGRFGQVLATLGPLLRNAGVQAMAGLLAGIESGAGRILDRARQLASDIASAFSGALQILSPSRVMAGLGENVVEGLIVGMERQRPALRLAVEDVAGYLTDAASVTRVGGPRSAGGAALEPLDYDRLGAAVARALEGRPQELRATLEVDGRQLASVTAPEIRGDQRSRS